MSSSDAAEPKTDVRMPDHAAKQSPFAGLHEQLLNTLDNLENNQPDAQPPSGTLPSGSVPFSDILATLQTLVSSQNRKNNGEESEESSLPVLQDMDKLSLTSYSLGYYISHCLPNEQTVPVLSLVNKSTTMWMSKLFQFSNCGAFYTENMILSYERVILLALFRTFGPEYFNASESPIIYCTPDPILFGTIKRTVLQIGMNENCIQTVQSQSNILYPYKTDLEALETCVKSNIENKKKPLIFFARTGAHVTGQMDDIVHLKELCTKYGIWLHLSGDNLSALALAKPNTEVCFVVNYY